MITIPNEFENLFSPQNAQRTGEEIGGNIAKGIGVGLDKNSIDAITETENIYVELETYTKNAAKNAENLEKKRHNRAISNLKNALDLGIISHQEYYEKLKVYRDTHLRQGTDIWFKCTEEIAKYNKEMISSAEKAEREYYEQMENIREGFRSRVEKTAADTVALHRSLKDKLKEKLTPDEALIDQKKIIIRGANKDGSDIVYTERSLGDIGGQIDETQEFRRIMHDLVALGKLPGEIFEELGKMDISDAIAAGQTILDADPKKLDEFIRDYLHRNSLNDAVAQEMYPLFNQEEIRRQANECGEAFLEGFMWGDSFEEILENSFKDVPAEYYQLGESAGAQFGAGFLESFRAVEALNISFNPSQADLSGTSGGGGDSNVFNTSYIFNSSKETTTQQLAAARNAETLYQLRGGA